MRTGVFCLSVMMSLVLLIFAVPLHAQDEREPVRLDGRTVFRVGPAADADAETRAQRIEQRLLTLLENPAAIAPAIIERSGSDERIVTVSGVPVVTVTQSDADDNLTSLDALATQWAQVVDVSLASGRERRDSAGWQVQILIEGAFVRLGESIQRVIPGVLAALLVLALFAVFALLVRRLLRMVLPLAVRDRTNEHLVRQIVYYTVWVLGIIVAINALGFDPQAIATGIGLTSLALGFALQDILSNFISGMLILLLRPFKLGDQIVIGETEGGVERINLRATQIRTYDGRVVLVPNAQLFTSRITNNTAAPVRRGTVEVILSYQQDLRRVIDILFDATRSSAGVLNEPMVTVRITRLGPQEIVLEARFWTDSRRSDFLATSSNVRLAIVEALRSADIELPDSSVRTLKPGNLPDWQALAQSTT